MQGLKRTFIIIMLKLGCVLVAGQASAAVDRLLDSVEYVSIDGHAVVRINLLERVVYIKHFPEKTGSTVEIQLQLFSLNTSQPQPQFDREVLLAPYSKLIPLAGVTQESADPAKLTITVRFSRKVNYSFKLASDNQAMLLHLPDIAFTEGSKRKVGENRRISAMEDVNVANSAEQARRLVEDARAFLKQGDAAGAMLKAGQALNLPDHPHRADAEAIFVEARKLQTATPRPAASQPQPEEPGSEITTTEEGGVETELDESAQLEQARQVLLAGQTEAAKRILTVLAQTAAPDVAKAAQELLEDPQRARKPVPPIATQSVRPFKQRNVAPKSKMEQNDIASGAAEDRARILINRANAAMTSGDVATAMALYSEAVALPTNAFTNEAERLLRTARGAQGRNASEDLTGVVIGDPQTLDDVQRLMEEGQLALRRGDNNRAIVIYTKVINLPKHAQQADGLEFLGVARQRNNQVARAKAIYEDYLKKYPTGEGADRVRQRLAEIVAASLSPKRAPRDKDGAKDDKMRVDKFVSWSQTYNWGVREVPVVEEGDVSTPTQPGQPETVREEDQSVLISYLAGNVRMRSGRYDIRSVVNGTHQKNYLREDNRDRFLVNQAYVDFNDREKHYQIKAGRQSGTISGTLGRFDGLMAGYDVMPKFRVNSAFGFPVDLSRKDTIDFGTKMYVANLQFKDVFPQLDFIPFASVQTVEGGELDRAAIGEEVRFFNQRGTFFHVLDYDTLYQALNLIYFQGQFNLNQDSAIYSSVDYRASPFYSLRSALYHPDSLTAGTTTFDTLWDRVSVDEARQLVTEQTGYATSVVLGINHSVSEKLQLSGDVTWANQAYSTAQLNSSETLPESENTMTYSARVTTIGLITRAEITIFSLTYTNSLQFNETQFLFQNRAPFLEGWRFDSEFRSNFRSDALGNEQRRLRPAIKLVYDWRGKWSVEAEVGGEITDYNSVEINPNALEQDTRYFGSIGYRVTF